jgi:putative transposase
MGGKFGRHFAKAIKRRSAGQLGDKWHLDEMVVTVAGKKQWLWRAVDQNGFVLDVLVQSRRNAKAARRLMRKLLKKQGHAPRVMITDKLGSYAVAGREIMPAVEHRRHKGLNNRAEKLPPADATTRTDHEAFQVTGPASAVRLHP